MSIAGHRFTKTFAPPLPRQARGSKTPQAIAIAWFFLSALARGAFAQADGTRPAVVYCSVDEGFAREVLAEYERRSGRKVTVVFDSEAGKVTGLVNRIVAEAESGRPRGDVFWSGELFNTILLSRKGLLESFAPPAAADIPPTFKDNQYRWTATSVRARVLAFDPKRTPASAVPTRWVQLGEREFAKRTAFANPIFGTARGHVAAMFALWGEARGRNFLQGLRDGGALMVDGNSAAVRALIAGRVEFAMTDTDDVWVAQREGASLDLRYLDLGDGGTLLIPCSVAIIKNGPSREAAEPLADFLVSADVERMLAKSDSRNIPVREALRQELGLELPPGSKVSADAVADAMDGAIAAVREILIR